MGGSPGFSAPGRPRLNPGLGSYWEALRIIHFQSPSGCSQNWATCRCRAEVPISISVVRSPQLLEAGRIPLFPLLYPPKSQQWQTVASHALGPSGLFLCLISPASLFCFSTLTLAVGNSAFQGSSDESGPLVTPALPLPRSADERWLSNRERASLDSCPPRCLPFVWGF